MLPFSSTYFTRVSAQRLLCLRDDAGAVGDVAMVMLVLLRGAGTYDGVGAGGGADVGDGAENGQIWV